MKQASCLPIDFHPPPVPFYPVLYSLQSPAYSILFSLLFPLTLPPVPFSFPPVPSPSIFFPLILPLNLPSVPYSLPSRSHLPYLQFLLNLSPFPSYLPFDILSPLFSRTHPASSSYPHSSISLALLFPLTLPPLPSHRPSSSLSTSLLSPLTFPPVPSHIPSCSLSPSLLFPLTVPSVPS